jgi:hypothetical protein
MTALLRLKLRRKKIELLKAYISPAGGRHTRLVDLSVQNAHWFNTAAGCHPVQSYMSPGGSKAANQKMPRNKFLEHAEPQKFESSGPSAVLGLVRTPRAGKQSRAPITPKNSRRLLSPNSSAWCQEGAWVA